MGQLSIELSEKDIEKFWKYVDKKSDDECWEWKAYKDTNGYGILRINPKTYRAHRISWVLHYGEIPACDSYHGMCVLHRCDNPACVNPHHLFLGTHKDNMGDMRDKGRGVTPDAKGERQGSHKLTEEEVKEIREKYIPLVYTQRMLAAEYGVVRETIHAVLTRRNWKHVADRTN